MPTIIEVANLVKRYPKAEQNAVDDVSFAVERGEIFAFLGPNGAGKTTTIKMLTTLLDPTSGRMLLNGHDPMRDSDAVRHAFGIVFQDPSLDDELTAEENLELHGVLYRVPKDLRKKRVEELLKMVDLSDRRRDYVKNFSGGMKRRLEIARGLLHHPKILFLDEPTLGLDPQTRNHIWNYIKKLNAEEQITIFFTTHYMDEADRMASRIAIIDHGKVVASGAPQKLKEQTKAATMEEAFLALTGHVMRDEAAGSIDLLRQGRRMWGGRR